MVIGVYKPTFTSGGAPSCNNHPLLIINYYHDGHIHSNIMDMDEITNTNNSNTIYLDSIPVIPPKSNELLIPFYYNYWNT